jgi:hypothetical protein
MRAKAAGVLKTLPAATHPKLGKVTFTNSGRKKTLFGKTTAHEFQSVKALPQIIAKGRIVSSEPDNKGRPGVAAFHTLESNLNIGEARYRAQVVVKEARQAGVSAHSFYLHRIREK